MKMEKPISIPGSSCVSHLNDGRWNATALQSHLQRTRNAESLHESYLGTLASIALPMTTHGHHGRKRLAVVPITAVPVTVVSVVTFSTSRTFGTRVNQQRSVSKALHSFFKVSPWPKIRKVGTAPHSRSERTFSLRVSRLHTSPRRAGL
jgi:hypothetical protein